MLEGHFGSFHSELCDLYHRQLASVLFPHASRLAFYVRAPLAKCSRFFAGMLQYLASLDYRPGSDWREVLAEAIYDASFTTTFGRRVASAADYPGNCQRFP